MASAKARTFVSPLLKSSCKRAVSAWSNRKIDISQISGRGICNSGYVRGPGITIVEISVGSGGSCSCAHREGYDAWVGPVSDATNTSRARLSKLKKASIVFAHGLWADGSCFQKLIPALQADGYDVISSQHGLDSLKSDVDCVTRCFGRASGPVVLVGHSYGGTLITHAGTDDRVRRPGLHLRARA